jgi:UTP:GlnB (protein PII) uridylyltransferase
MHALRVIGPDRPGLLAEIARTLADAGIRIDGLWAAALGGRAVQYVRLESYTAAKRAAQILTPKLA